MIGSSLPTTQVQNSRNSKNNVKLSIGAKKLTKKRVKHTNRQFDEQKKGQENGLTGRDIDKTLI